MRFNDHPHLEGLHAFLSPSQSAWVNYDEERITERFKTSQLAAHGTRLHEFAKECILLGQNLKATKQTLNRYVNDAIGFRMIPEQILYYSINCFGTADAIKFDERRNVLRIHDLKTGVTKASLRQLRVYAALFCLEYDVRPGDLKMLLRIYQNDEVVEEEADVDEIVHIMDRIVTWDKHLEILKEGLL